METCALHSGMDERIKTQEKTSERQRVEIENLKQCKLDKTELETVKEEVKLIREAENQLDKRVSGYVAKIAGIVTAVGFILGITMKFLDKLIK